MKNGCFFETHPGYEEVIASTVRDMYESSCQKNYSALPHTYNREKKIIIFLSSSAFTVFRDNEEPDLSLAVFQCYLL